MNRFFFSELVEPNQTEALRTSVSAKNLLYCSTEEKKSILFSSIEWPEAEVSSQHIFTFVCAIRLRP